MTINPLNLRSDRHNMAGGRKVNLFNHNARKFTRIFDIAFIFAWLSIWHRYSIHRLPEYRIFATNTRDYRENCKMNLWIILFVQKK